jgi:chromosome segregation ATPase
MVAQAEVSELKTRLEKAEQERDEAIAQRKEADRSAKKTMEAWNQVRKDLDAAKREREDLITSRNAIALERDTLKSHLVSVESERDELLAQLKQRDEEINALRTAHKVIAETPAEVVRETEQPVIAQTEQDEPSVTTINSPRYKNDALRARYRALNTSLRPFVSKHNITRTPFQKWVAGERDMHGETLQKYEAAIRSEES